MPGAVSAQLAVWPEASQHWCLQAVGWGWPPPPNSLAPGAHELKGGSHNDVYQHQCPAVEGASKYGCYQCPCPQGEPHPCPAPLGHALRLACRSGPGSYQITTFALGPSACEILCVPFKSVASISPSPLGHPKLGPCMP